MNSQSHWQWRAATMLLPTRLFSLLMDTNSLLIKFVKLACLSSMLTVVLTLAFQIQELEQQEVEIGWAPISWVVPALLERHPLETTSMKTWACLTKSGTCRQNTGRPHRASQTWTGNTKQLTCFKIANKPTNNKVYFFKKAPILNRLNPKLSELTNKKFKKITVWLKVKES